VLLENPFEAGNRIMAKRILIVEDNRAARRALAALLTKLGLVAVEAGTVAQGTELLARTIDVICLDLVLPDGNGLEILQQVRREGLDAKVAVISGADDAEMIQAVMALKPDAIFGKPLEVEDFLNWLDSSGIATGNSKRPSWQVQDAQRALRDDDASDRKKCA
jgi:DNA-binding response OmpR family regulator